ncbi:MAG: hypothetical protein EKK54_06280 [Neisseriaceae bacterium]|nr:MAG: hypothetical protein EKK54_06280 [Neisseriaceae bacterium]
MITVLEVLSILYVFFTIFDTIYSKKPLKNILHCIWLMLLFLVINTLQKNYDYIHNLHMSYKILLILFMFFTLALFLYWFIIGFLKSIKYK